MKNVIGKELTMTLFGESHGEAIGCVLDGIPSGIKIDEDYISKKRGDHGHGLKRINLIVEKYEGYINRKNEPGVFVTEVMLPL